MSIYKFINYEWSPSSNTIAYYPLDSTNQYLDKSWNNKNLTNNWLTIWTYQWVSSAYNNWTSTKYAYLSTPLFTWNWQWTVSSWFYSLWNDSWWQSIIQVWYWSWTQAFNMAINKNVIYFWWWTNDTSTWVTKINQRVNYIVTNNNWTINAYINWELVKTATLTYTIPSSGKTSIWSNYIRTDWWTSDPWNWYLSKIIVENKTRTSSDVKNYYLSTKSLYWL